MDVVIASPAGVVGDDDTLAIRVAIVDESMESYIMPGRTYLATEGTALSAGGARRLPTRARSLFLSRTSF